MLLSRAVDTHLGSIVRQVFAMTRQRTDTDRTRPGMVLTSNLRKRLHELNTRERDRQKAQEAREAEAQQVRCYTIRCINAGEVILSSDL